MPQHLRYSVYIHRKICSTGITFFFSSNFYLLQIMCIAYFCSLNNLFKFVIYVLCQATLEQLMQLWIYKQHKDMRDCLFKYGSALNNKLIFFAIFFLIYVIHDSQVEILSNKTPINLIDSVRLIYLLFVFSLGSKGNIIFFTSFMEK